jgi:hypothetical protein
MVGATLLKTARIDDFQRSLGTLLGTTLATYWIAGECAHVRNRPRERCSPCTAEVRSAIHRVTFDRSEALVGRC